MAVERADVSPELQAAVARARAVAEVAGELSARRPGLPRSPIPGAVADALVALLRDGTYDAAIARIVEDDPELADC